jgi:hypothetical protein
MLVGLKVGCLDVGCLEVGFLEAGRPKMDV